jgi:hypothetical protein
MNKKFFKGPAWPLLAAAVLLGATPWRRINQPVPGHGKPAKSKSKKAPAKSGAASPGGKVKFIPGSAETPAQRSARLKRECKGGVDAGACAGYTH